MGGADMGAADMGATDQGQPDQEATDHAVCRVTGSLMLNAASTDTQPMIQRLLCPPAPNFATSYVEALREGYRLGDDPPFDEATIAAIAADFPAHLAAITRQGVLHTVPGGSSAPISPFSLFWLIENGREFLGSVHLRHELTNDYARLIAGHVRYGIPPSRRNLGLGTEMLTAARSNAAALGQRRILVVCREANLPSRRLIEKCGGAFERSVLDPYGEGIKRRYWLEV
jgi:predicted acetyltransferase